MKLADLRKLSIKQKTRICFTVAGGLECVITEHGIAQVPGLRGAPAFNLESELAAAREFRFEPVAEQDSKHPEPTRSLTRDEVARLLGPASATAAADHEDE
ncbi:MAG: hypothetical protein WCB12_00820 [Bryobacteraceae bacterium]